MNFLIDPIEVSFWQWGVESVVDLIQHFRTVDHDSDVVKKKSIEI